MAVNVSTQGPFFATGSISWSDLREQFRAANIDGSFDTDTAAISVSELYRNTSLALTDPVVPDCTENRTSGPSSNGVPQSGSFSISRMRRSIKYYFLNQVNNDLNLDLDNQNYNANINLNVRKRFRIEGTIGSSNTANPAATFNATATNVRLEIRNTGRVLGASGPAGAFPNGEGQDGGVALSLNSTGGNNNVVFLNPTANVYGGGGGGDGGANGARNVSSQRNWGGSQTSFIQCVPTGNGVRCFTVCVNDGGASSCRGNAPSGAVDNTIGCQSGYNPPGCACGSCIGTVVTSVASAGSVGRAGRGFNNQTVTLLSDATEGGTAVQGGNGGDWGRSGNGANNVANGGGAGGDAIGGAGNNWTITGTQNNTTLRVNTF